MRTVDTRNESMTNKHADVPTVTLGDELTVSAIGFGAMALTPVYGEVDDTESLATLHSCLDLGVTFIDTANVYGGGNNEQLISKLLADRRDEVTLATKFGIAGNPADRAAGDLVAHGDAAYVHKSIDESLSRLKTDIVDLYYMHRRDPSVPIEETVGAMAELVKAGKVRHLGLSEVTADELRAAVAVHPIAAVQSEWSIWSRDVERNVVPTAAELGVGFVPYSPLGRGFLTGTVRSAADLGSGNDFRKTMPRFAEGALDANLAVVEVVDVGRRGGGRDGSPGRVGVVEVSRRHIRCRIGSDSRHAAGRAGRGEPRFVVGGARCGSDQSAGRGRRCGVREQVPRYELGVGRPRVARHGGIARHEARWCTANPSNSGCRIWVGDGAELPAHHRLAVIAERRVRRYGGCGRLRLDADAVANPGGLQSQSMPPASARMAAALSR